MTKKAEFHVGSLVINRMASSWSRVPTSESHHKNIVDRNNNRLKFTTFAHPGLVIRWLGPGTHGATDEYWEILLDDGVLGVSAGYLLKEVNDND